VSTRTEARRQQYAVGCMAEESHISRRTGSFCNMSRYSSLMAMYIQLVPHTKPLQINEVKTRPVTESVHKPPDFVDTIQHERGRGQGMRNKSDIRTP
jgi:hypothetical protein